MITKYVAKSALGGTGRKIKMEGMIGTHRAAAASNISKNSFMACDFPEQHLQRRNQKENPITHRIKTLTNQGKGMFFLIEKLQRCVFVSGIRGHQLVHIQDLPSKKEQWLEKRAICIRVGEGWRAQTTTEKSLAQKKQG